MDARFLLENIEKGFQILENNVKIDKRFEKLKHLFCDSHGILYVSSEDIEGEKYYPSRRPMPLLRRMWIMPWAASDL